MLFSDKKSSTELTAVDKKIRTTVLCVCAVILCGIAIMYFFFGIGKMYTAAKYEKNGEEYEFSPKTKKTVKNVGGINAAKFSGWDKIETKADEKTAVLYKKNSDGTYKAAFFDGKNINTIADSCFAAAVAGKYFVFETDKTIYFSNGKTQSSLNLSKLDEKSVEISPDGRYILFISGENRQLNVFGLDITQGSVSNGKKLGENVKTAVFSGRKHDVGYISENGDFYYSYDGVSVKADEGAECLASGSDVMSFYYIADGKVICYTEGKKETVYFGASDFVYTGAKTVCVLADYDGKTGNLFYIDKGKEKLVDSGVSGIKKGN